MVSTMSSTRRTSEPSNCVDLAGHLLEHRVAVDRGRRTRTWPHCTGRAGEGRAGTDGRRRAAHALRRRSGRPPPASRSAGRGTAASASHRTRVVGRPDQPAVAVHRRHGDAARRRPGLRRRPAAPGPRSRARAPNGGSPRDRRMRPLGHGQERRDRRGPRPGAPRGRGSGSGPAPGRPPSRVPTSRAARANRASVSSPAPKRGASRCWSMSRKATTSARVTRWRAASVPTTSRAPGRPSAGRGRR